MRRLDRYVMKEMLVPFIAGTFIVALLFQANSYLFIAKEYNLDNVPMLARIQWLLYTLPSQIKLTLPTGMALAAALSIGRMGRESEITALRASGMPMRRLMVPVIFFGLLAGGMNYLIVDRLIPTYGPKSEELLQKNAILATTTSSSTFKSNAFISLQNYAVSLGAVRRTGRDVLSIQDVMLIERANSGVKSIFVSPTGTYDAGVWRFPDGLEYMVKGDNLEIMSARTIVIDQSVDLKELFSGAMMGLHSSDEHTPTAALPGKVALAKLNKQNWRPIEIEYHVRFAASVACAVFAFTSAVFAALFSRSGGFAGLLVSFSVVVLYFNAYVVSVEILGKRDDIPTWLNAWGPNIVFGLLGLVALRKLE